MKALSVWQPWASLIFSKDKKVETRSWPAPHSIRGQRIAIASTRSIRKEERAATAEDHFQRHYQATGLPLLIDLPMGCVLGTVVIAECRMIDQDFLDHLDEQEEAFGVYSPGRFAWILSDPQALEKPVPVRGAQGLWNSQATWVQQDGFA